MNAAARSMSSSTWFRGHVKQMAMSRSGWLILMLLTAVLFSALAVVYIKNEQRTYLSQWEIERQATRQLNLDWDKLMLERTALSAPARVQAIAQEKLNMHIPGSAEIQLIQEPSILAHE